MLQVLIEHKGEMPGKTQGYKPLSVSRTALEVEWIITDIARENLRRACILRAYFCGRGRRKVERLETARLLIATAEAGRLRGSLPSERRYLEQVELGIRSEEHTSELQSLMRISYAVFCLKKKNNSKSHLNI